jgi:hypothetical protein
MTWNSDSTSMILIAILVTLLLLAWVFIPA